MEQVELFPINILYKGIIIEYDIEIYKESEIVNHKRKKMDEIKYRNKTNGR